MTINFMHKWYRGRIIEIDEETGIFYGELIDIGDDVVTFQGTIREIQQAFNDSVDDYLEFCEKRNEKPNKPGVLLGKRYYDSS